jgi:hypothetical protein
MKGRTLGILAWVASSLAAGPVDAQTSRGDPSDAASSPAPRSAFEAEAEAAEEAWQSWIPTLEAGRDKLVAARARVVELEEAVGRSSHRRYPRGEKKAEWLAELAEAREALAEAEAEYPELLEEARRGGVPPGILADYEEVPGALPEG